MKSLKEAGEYKDFFKFVHSEGKLENSVSKNYQKKKNIYRYIR